MKLIITRHKRQEEVCSFELRGHIECSSAERNGVRFYQAVEHLEPAQGTIIRALLNGSIAETSDDLCAIELLEQKILDSCTALGEYLHRASTYGDGENRGKEIIIATLSDRIFSLGSAKQD